MRSTKLCTILLIILAAALPIQAQTPGAEDLPSPDTPDSAEQLLRPDEVGSPCLLLHSAVAGKYHLAPVLETEVAITVRGLVSEGLVTQRFRNPSESWMEGIYVFPLPNRSAVHEMRLQVGERIIVGEIKERQEAKKVYSEAKRVGKKASLVEQERPNIFTMSVANIAPGEEVAVSLTYQETLELDSGEVELRFPLVVGPRYIPGSVAETGADGGGWSPDTDQVPDASRITPPVIPPGSQPENEIEGLRSSQNPVERVRSSQSPVHLEVTLEPGFPLAKLSSPYHEVSISRPSSSVHRVRLDSAPADRDFVLRWTPQRGREPQAAVFTEQLDGDYYVLAMVVPPADELSSEVRLPRETVLVIDTSGSMGGASIRQARQALLFALDQLHPEDYFNIIEFDSSFTMLFDDSQPAMPAAVDRAHSWVEKLDANGGTEILPALRRALEDSDRYTPLRQVVFITDGCVGNESQLFATIERELGRSRLFTVGIGSAPNSHFMERAASFGRGSFTYIGSPSEVTSKMQALFNKLENPVLADIELRWPDPHAEVWPQRIPDLYAGETLLVAARLATISGELELSGLCADRPWQVTVPMTVGTEHAGVNRLWARRKIAALMDELSRGAEEELIRQQVIAVALRHHLVSRYTSLVAVDVTPVRPQGEGLDCAAVPTNLPAGWQYEKVFGTLPRGGTAGRLHLLLGLLALLCGLALRRAARGSA